MSDLQQPRHISTLPHAVLPTTPCARQVRPSKQTLFQMRNMLQLGPPHRVTRSIAAASRVGRARAQKNRNSFTVVVPAEVTC